MEALFLSACSLGLDGFLVCLGLGYLGLPRATKYRLAAAFAACDGGATLLGAKFGPGSPWLAAAEPALVLLPALLVLYGIYALGIGSQGQARRYHWFPYLLPVLLSLDNLIAGWTSGEPGLPFAAGLASGAMALAGLTLGERFAQLPLVSRVEAAGPSSPRRSSELR